MPMNFNSVWAAMEDCQRLGLTKSIGVSNFSCKKLADILSFANIPPAVNEVELNPIWKQEKLSKFCKENGILLTAYAPLGAKGTIWGSNKVLECQVLNEIAKEKGKTVAQSFNKERMKSNLDIFDWSLSKDELEKINEIPQSRLCR
ncbi:Aldo/keto reductase [Corchorus olitorius]|uniref:Aldo/keto reductase n=1 Tax=Corchorus olitorius TaxID=93759 RepID=A0A1R3G715_9ROSI|nr:Aldo/keto reductase [Corchorus olitorius]